MPREAGPYLAGSNALWKLPFPCNFSSWWCSSSPGTESQARTISTIRKIANLRHDSAFCTRNWSISTVHHPYRQQKNPGKLYLCSCTNSCFKPFIFWLVILVQFLLNGLQKPLRERMRGARIYAAPKKSCFNENKQTNQLRDYWTLMSPGHLTPSQSINTYIFRILVIWIHDDFWCCKLIQRTKRVPSLDLSHCEINETKHWKCKTSTKKTILSLEIWAFFRGLKKDNSWFSK